MLSRSSRVPRACCREKELLRDSSTSTYVFARSTATLGLNAAAVIVTVPSLAIVNAMRVSQTFARLTVASILLGAPLASGAALADQIPGMGNLSGKIATPKNIGQLSVYALNTGKNVGYMVYVVKGAYRAVNMFPGHYEVTLRGTKVGQHEVKVQVRSDKLQQPATASVQTTVSQQ